MSYQKKDYEIIDYQEYMLEEIPNFSLRGPSPTDKLEKGKYIVCLGAAQTFGRFVEKPFPQLLSDTLNIPVVNMGHAGAGPSFYSKKMKMIEFINNAQFAIVQVMPGRSMGNSLYETKTGGEMLLRKSDNQKIGASNAWKEILENYSKEEVEQLVSETRKNWHSEMKELLNSIKIPTILFWFSHRVPKYQEEYKNVSKLFGYGSPQLINENMIDNIKPYADYYVESISDDGLPQKLYNRFTKEEATVTGREDLGSKKLAHNYYYASPKMHEKAFKNILPTCQKLVNLKY